MINLKKADALTLEHIYSLKVSEYTSDINECWDDEGNPSIYVGEASLRITKEDFEALKEAGIKCEEFTVAVIASSDNCTSLVYPIRQILYQHIAYVDKAKHTNF